MEPPLKLSIIETKPSIALVPPQRIDEVQWLTPHISISGRTAFKSNRVTLYIAPGARLVIPEVVVIQPRRRVIPLPRKPHIQHERSPILIRILVRHAVAEGLPLRIPGPDCDIARRVDHRARGAQVVDLEVMQFLRRGRRRPVVRPGCRPSTRSAATARRCRCSRRPNGRLRRTGSLYRGAAGRKIAPAKRSARPPSLRTGL